jgi:hypothetical protein
MYTIDSGIAALMGQKVYRKWDLMSIEHQKQESLQQYALLLHLLSFFVLHSAFVKFIKHAFFASF